MGAAAAALLLACSGPPAPPPEEPQATPPGVVAEVEVDVEAAPGASAGIVRLDPQVVPVAYELRLRIDPSRATFHGRVEIDLELAGPRDAIVLHAARTLDIQATTLDDQVVALERLDDERIALRPPDPLGAGAHAIELEWDAPLEEAMMGLYRVEVAGEWYVFTQMEPISARDALPCFDEPRFKTPWTVTVEAPEGLVVAANAPLAELTNPRPIAGTSRHRFATSEPLPTYLFALAVGPFDVVEAPPDALPGAVPFRILTVKGSGERVSYPLAQTGAILETLGAYFGEPYPYAKLDFVAVPNFSAGAMENPGLVTFRETLLMVSADDPPSVRRSSLSVIGHELAHMWFGNLVSPAWWDEIWLNEAFATWMGSRVLEAVAPELEAQLGLTSWAGYVMGSDARLAARAVRQPIASNGDIHNAFDGITYGKGAAVLRMLEHWLGEATFRDAVRSYLDAHRWGSATTDDLLAALLAARPDMPVREVLSSFVDQPGVPLIELAWSCDPAAPALVLEATQRRFLPEGVEAPEPQAWRLPVCVRYGGGDGTASSACFLLEELAQTTTLELAEPGSGCPVWLYPNADALGYYRWSLPSAQVLALLESHRSALSTAELTSLTSQLGALLEAGQLDVATWVRGLELLSAEEHRLVVGGVIGSLELMHERLVPDALRPSFAAWARGVLEPHAARLGHEPRADEPVGDRLLRPQVLSALAEIGRDEALRAAALETTRAFLSDPASVPVDVARQAVPLAAQDGDAALWGSLRALLEREGLAPHPRAVVLSALGSFRDPALLERSLALTLDGTARGQDFGALAGPGLGTDATALLVWGWVTTNYDAVRALLGDEQAAGLPWIGRRFCDEAGAAQVEAFFGAPEHAPEGTARALAQTLESIERCQRLRAATAEGLAEVFGAL